MAWLPDLNDDAFLRVNDFARHTTWLHAPLVDYARYGVVLFAAAIVISAVYARRSDARTLAASVWAGLGTLVAVAVNQPIGNAVGEARPYATHPGSLLLVSPTADFSFPSDHAVMAGAVAAGLFLVSRRLGMLVAVAALVMAFARVYVGAHYPADVLAGLLVGAAVVSLGWVLVGRALTRAAETLRAGRLGWLLQSEAGDDRTRTVSLKS